MDLGIPELAGEQIEEISQEAEGAARKLVFSKVKQKQVDRLNISVEAEGTKPVTFTVEVYLVLLPGTGVDEKALAEDAVKVAFGTIESLLRKMT